jgi:hypothetical protein
VTQSIPITILTRKRAWAFRRAETVGKALERLEGTKEYPNVLQRHRMYLQSVASLTLAIEAVRMVEEKEVRVLGSLAT